MRMLNNDRLGGTPAPFGRLALVAQSLVALVVLGYAVSSQGIAIPGTDPHFEIEATFADAAGLQPDYRPAVLVAGVVLGHVSDVKQKGGKAVATLRLKDEAKGKIHDDATARITPRSAINDLVVDIDPGTTGTLDEGETIGSRGNASPVGLDRVLGVLNADTRAYAQVLLDQADIGLNGRTKQVRETIAQLSALMDPSTQVAVSLADRSTELRRLVGNLDVVFGTLGRRGRELATVVGKGRETLAATETRSSELSTSVALLPRTLRAVQHGLEGVRALERPLVPALRALIPTASSLPGGLRALRDFAPDANSLVGDLNTFSVRASKPSLELRRLLTRIGPTTRSLRPALTDLGPTLDTLNRALPGYAQLGDNFSGIFSTNDVNGPRLRALGFFEAPNAANLGMGGSSRTKVASTLARAFAKTCDGGNIPACLLRYSVPGLPGSTQRTAPRMQAAPIPLGEGTRLTQRPGSGAPSRPASDVARSVDDVAAAVKKLVDFLGTNTNKKAK